MTAERAQKANPASPLRGSRWIHRCLGAGAYPFLSKWLDASRQFSQSVYAQLLSNLIPMLGLGNSVENDWRLLSISPACHLIRTCREISVSATGRHRVGLQ